MDCLNDFPLGLFKEALNIARAKEFLNVGMYCGLSLDISPVG
jgi:hypothetical protein